MAPNNLVDAIKLKRNAVSILEYSTSSPSSIRIGSKYFVCVVYASFPFNGEGIRSSPVVPCLEFQAVLLHFFYRYAQNWFKKSHFSSWCWLLNVKVMNWLKRLPKWAKFWMFLCYLRFKYPKIGSKMIFTTSISQFTSQPHNRRINWF